MPEGIARYRGLPKHRPILAGYATKGDETACVIACACGADIRAPNWTKAGRDFDVHLSFWDEKNIGSAIGAEPDG